MEAEDPLLVFKPLSFLSGYAAPNPNLFSREWIANVGTRGLSTDANGTCRGAFGITVSLKFSTREPDAARCVIYA